MHKKTRKHDSSDAVSQSHINNAHAQRSEKQSVIDHVNHTPSSVKQS